MSCEWTRTSFLGDKIKKVFYDVDGVDQKLPVPFLGRVESKIWSGLHLGLLPCAFSTSDAMLSLQFSL